MPQENKMRFSPNPTVQKDNMVENERVETFWSSKNNTKEGHERKMKSKDIQERFSHKIQKRCTSSTEAMNLGKTQKARNSSRLKGLINRMNSQTDIHSNSQMETKTNLPLTHRGAHNEYNQIGNGLLGSTNDAIGSINKKPSKML